MSKEKFNNTFQVSKPIIGMIHLKGSDRKEIYERAMNEVALLLENGIDAVLVENYFGDELDVEYVIATLDQDYPAINYGINILGNIESAFDLAKQYNPRFIQIDSVAGHLPVYMEDAYYRKLDALRSSYDGLLLGGVRFKYKDVLSDRSVSEDLAIGIKHCDAIVVTGDATGMQTDLEKIKLFRKIIKDFPLIVGAGLTPENCIEQLAVADAGIIGSYLKIGHKDSGELSRENTQVFSGKIRTLRKE